MGSYKLGKNTVIGLRLLSGYENYIPMRAQIRGKLRLYCGGKKCTFMEDSGKESQNYTYFIRSMGNVDW